MCQAWKVTLGGVLRKSSDQLFDIAVDLEKNNKREDARLFISGDE